MGFPMVPVTHPVLMTALAPLYQALWSGRLPDVAAGQAFWASTLDSPGLIAGGLARLWQAGDPPAPPPEPPWTAHGTAGFGKGTSNCSH
jgi:hypothetical protein